MIDFFLICISIALGIMCPISISHILAYRKEKKYTTSHEIKYELNNLILEKSIALEALNKIEKFFKEEKIDKNEKDKLVLKYNKIIDNYNKKILKLKPIVEIQDIYEHRNQLYSWISDYIGKLDKRLTDFSYYIDHFNKNNKEIDKETSSVPISLQAIDMFKRHKKEFMDKYKSSNIQFEEIKEKNVNISNYKDIKTNQANSIRHTTDKDTDFIDNSNTEKEIHLKYDNMSIDKINKAKEEEKEINLEEIEKIQKDILKILQRLDSSA